MLLFNLPTQYLYSISMIRPHHHYKCLRMNHTSSTRMWRLNSATRRYVAHLWRFSILCLFSKTFEEVSIQLSCRFISREWYPCETLSSMRYIHDHPDVMRPHDVRIMCETTRPHHQCDMLSLIDAMNARHLITLSSSTLQHEKDKRIIHIWEIFTTVRSQRRWTRHDIL